MNSSEHKFKRKLSNILINPTFQMRMALRFIVIYIVVAGIFQVFFMILLNKYMDNFVKAFPITTNQHLVLHDIIIQIILAMSLLILIGALSIFIMAVYYSHKIAGPIYVIKNNINKLIEKDFQIRSNFRDGDEFNEISESLNRLADILKKETNTKN